MEFIVAAVLVGAFVVFVLPAILSALVAVGALLLVGGCIITVVLAILSMMSGG